MSIKNLSVLAAIQLAAACFCSAQQPYQFTATINPVGITIVRDSFGVPHIFAKTDAEVAYGLAWANAEDGFETMQESLLAGKGMMGRIKGKEGAEIDFFVHAIGAKEIVNERFYEDLTPEYIRYLEGFCQGFNAFAKKYPERVLLKKAFPVTPKDIMQAYVITFSALTGVSDKLGDVMSGNYDEQWLNMFGDEHSPQNGQPQTDSRGLHKILPSYSLNEGGRVAAGSNAFAMNKNISADGSTYLCINPHMMVDGPFSFYEAHLCSEEGLNITGTLFQGGTCVFMGNNENLGWSHTYNHFDGVDVYGLKMHPEKKLQYELDGKYYPLEKRKVWLKVKIKKALPVIPVPKITYWSAHFGPVFKSKGGNFYAIRGLAFKTIRAGQQFYYMDKARDFKEFKAALDMQGLGMFSVIYADREGNIYYLHNGLIPDRKIAYDWNGLVPGNDSKYLWEKAFPVDSLPHSLNPQCGYVFNTNNTPFNATCYGENDNPARLPEYVDSRPGDNNRSMRFMELIDEKPAFTFDDFKNIKFDYRWPQASEFQESVKGMYEITPQEFPGIADVIAIIQSWDKVCDTTSIGATVFGLMMSSLLKDQKDNLEFSMGIINLAKDDFVKAYRLAKDHLLKYFGTVNVPLGKMQKFVRGEQAYAIPGYPDALMANYPQKPYKDGMFKLEYGDTYIQFVKFSQNGVERIESLLPYNSLPTASLYKDQTLLYQKLQTKVASLSREIVTKKAMKVYKPE